MPNLLESHFDAIEKNLISLSEIAHNAGHPNLKGGPREWFIHDFLSQHMPSNFETGQGEVFDQFSEPNPKNTRSQIDIVIYNRELPRLTYSPNNNAYLIEGVIATIEIKSQLAKEDIKQICHMAGYLQRLERIEGEDQSGSENSTLYPINYIVAYKGPQFKTIKNWLDSLEEMKPENIHMIVILGKGIMFRSDTFGSFSYDSDGKPVKSPQSSSDWGYIEQESLNLLILFMHFLSWTSQISKRPNLMGYYDYETIPYKTF